MLEGWDGTIKDPDEVLYEISMKEDEILYQEFLEKFNFNKLKVDAIIQKLEKKIDDVDAKTGDRWGLLVRDHDGKVTLEEIASATTYLKDRLGTEGLQELINNVSKDRGNSLKLPISCRLPILQGDNWWRGHARAFRKYGICLLKPFDKAVYVRQGVKQRTLLRFFIILNVF